VSQLTTIVKDPGPDWVTLPSARSPRWWLPREPPVQARAGLSVYHPVTIRSLVGWELARALARRGAFKLRRGYGLLPREVWEAAGHLVPAGGSLAVARANHPGRFLAIVLDSTGRSSMFVKVARDTPGARALATERQALEAFGAALPPPLIAPKLLGDSEGVLVFESLEWRARALPWRLPQEVAFALGVFFRSASDSAGSTGVAHGDFAPWNLLRTETGWALVDWEDFRADAPAYFDLFHYMIQANSELWRPLRRTIVDGVALKGWVGDVIRAYAAGAEIDAGESPHFLREYLRISSATLDPNAPARGARVRSKMSAELGG